MADQDDAPDDENRTNDIDYNDNPEEQTAIEEASVIHLLRILVAGAAPPALLLRTDDAMDHDATLSEEAQQRSQDISSEEAGCMLWDMSASRPVARILLRNRALDALEIVIARELLVAHQTSLESLTLAAVAAAADDDDNAAADVANTSGLPDAAAAAVPFSRLPLQTQIQNSLRILEICLGTLANLVVTLPAAAADVSSRPALLGLLLAPPEAAAYGTAGADGSAAGGSGGRDDSDTGGGGGVLWVDDARVLSQLFRLLSVALRCQGSAAWLAAVRAPAALRRAVWAAAATADAALFASCLDSLVALLHAAATPPEPAPSTAHLSAAAPVPSTAAPAAAAPAAPELAATEEAAAPSGGPAGGAAAAAAAAAAGQAAAATATATERMQRQQGQQGQQDSGATLPPETAAAAADAAAGRVCGRLLRCGLLELVHQVLLGALRVGRQQDDEEDGALGDLYYGGDLAVGSEYGSRGLDGGGGGAPAADAAAGGGSEVVRSQPGGPRGAEGTSGGGDGGGGGEDDDDDDDRDAEEAAADAAVAAAAAAGPVPLSDEAVDAALRLLEELIALSHRIPLLFSPRSATPAAATAAGTSATPIATTSTQAAVAASTAAPASGPGHGPGGPPAALYPAPGSVSGPASSLTPASGPAALLQLHASRGLRPGLLQLLLGLLRHSSDNMQVLEGLLVVLVDFGPAVQQAVQAAPPAEAAAVAVRLAEILHDSTWFGNDTLSSAPAVADGPYSSPCGVVQLQIGAWYLLAATLRAAVTAAGAAAGNDNGGAEAALPSGEWLRQWPSLGRVLTRLSELPRPEGCSGYVRACCSAGMKLVTLLPRPNEAALVSLGGDRRGGEGAVGGWGEAGGMGEEQDVVPGTVWHVIQKILQELQNDREGGR